VSLQILLWITLGVSMIGNNCFFDDNFEVVLADTPESKALHFNIRYQVYCDEMGFEDKQNFPNQLEFDMWDKHSVHFLVRDKQLGHWVGALRLVFSDNKPFPFEHHCSLEKSIGPNQYMQSVELSRLCVLKELRRFAARRFAPYEASKQDSKDMHKSNVTVLHKYKNVGLTVMWGLLRAAALYCKQSNINDLYLLVAPALAFAIRKEGFDFEQIGEPCQHRGQRIPFQWEIDNVLANPLWEKDYKYGFTYFSDRFADEVVYQKLA